MAAKVVILLLSAHLLLKPSAAQLRQDFYADTCPEVETIVRSAVTKKFNETFVTAPAILRLYFHDCCIEGCDASVLISSTANNTAERDNQINLSLAGDGFDTVAKAKAAVDAVRHCQNVVSCADILALAARDVIFLTGGPSYPVELGRRDGFISTSASVDGNLPLPTFNVSQLTAFFAALNLSQSEMIALSASHTIGFSHCDQFADRIYNFGGVIGAIDPSLNRTYAMQLQSACPPGVNPTVAVGMDAVTPRIFDNRYFLNLQQGMGLFTSDQDLAQNSITRSIVDRWASSPEAFNQSFVSAITKMGRAGVKTDPSDGDIRIDCAVLN